MASDAKVLPGCHPECPGCLYGAADESVASSIRSDLGPLEVSQGCGYWLGDAAGEWFGCVIPDADHHGRDHILARGNL